MVVKLTRGKGRKREEWLVKTGEADEQAAREAIDRMLLYDDNGGGWTFDSVVHEHSFPHELEPAE